jgi:ATP-dependent RNA helicase RhlE
MLRDIERLLGRPIPTETIAGFEPDRSIRPQAIRLRQAPGRPMPAGRPMGGRPMPATRTGAPRPWQAPTSTARLPARPPAGFGRPSQPSQAQAPRRHIEFAALPGERFARAGQRDRD